MTKKTKLCSARVFLALGLTMLWVSPLRADSVIQLNLRELCQRADKIFRGTVIAAIPGKVRVVGGELPIVTYRIRVDESFKGDFQVVKGMRFVEVRMLAMDQAGARSSSRMAGLVSEIPRLEAGGRYLLLTTRPSAVGLSAPVGLGQGAFRIRGGAGGEEAINAHDNRMLFRNMGAEERQAAGPQKYGRLAERIRRLVREERSKR